MLGAKAALDRPWTGVLGGGHIIGFVSEGFSGTIRKFLILSFDPANGVHGSIIPRNPCFSIDINPFPVNSMKRTPGGAVVVESDVEGATGTVADLPLADEMSARRGAGWH